MKLSALERLVILGTLPKEGSYATLKILMNLKMSLAFTEEEIKKWGIVSDLAKNQTAWKTNGETEIPIGEKATDIIVDALKKLDQQNKLPAEAMSAYEKFVQEK